MDIINLLKGWEKLNTVLFASSSPFDERKVENFIDHIGKLGKIKLDLLISDTKCELKNANIYNYLFEPSKERQVERFLSLITNPKIHIIWCIRGGYGIYRWLSELIKNPSISLPKTIPLIIGFSDVTYLHLWASNHGYLSLHAPLVTTFLESSPKTREHLQEFLCEGRINPYNGKVFRSAKVEGTIIGGNLSCLVSTIGTPLEPDWTEKILFLEDQNEAPYRIDRMLTQLKNRGVFRKINALCLGEFYYGNEKLDMSRIIKLSLDDIILPILYDLPIGHGKDNYPLLLGAKYIIDGESLIPAI